MKVLDIEIQGLRTFIPEIPLKLHFQCITKEYGTHYFGPNKGKYGLKIETTNLYKSVRSKGFYTGFGAISWLNGRSDSVGFRIKSVEPLRRPLSSIEIPELITTSPKFLVNGKERFYFYEALQACKVKPMGTIKLPTGCGKTEIELTLAYNQIKQIGTGLILVPTVAIKEQFIDRARKYGLKPLEYSEYSSDLKSNEVFIYTHHKISRDLSDKAKKKTAREFLEAMSWVILDECHHGSSNSWFDIILNLTNCERCHGFSALPITETVHNATDFNDLSPEDAKIISLLGPIIYEKSAYDLRDFLNLPSLINLAYRWPDKISEYQKATTWAEAGKAILDNFDRTDFLAKIIDYFVTEGYKICTFVGQKEHALQIMREAKNPGLVSWFGQGTAVFSDKSGNLLTKKDYSDTIRQEFGNSIFGLILTSHGIEGLDLDDPINVLLLHEGRSIRQSIQETGRVVRVDDKASMVINLWESNCNIFPKHSKYRNSIIQEEFNCEPIACHEYDTLRHIVTQIEEDKANA